MCAHRNIRVKYKWAYQPCVLLVQFSHLIIVGGNKVLVLVELSLPLTSLGKFG